MMLQQLALFILGLCFIHLTEAQEVFSSQQIEESLFAQIHYAHTKKKARKMAQKDIENGRVFIILEGNIVPAISGTEYLFTDKFGAQFQHQGCTAEPEKITAAYNSVVFDHLTNRYGRKWLKSVRKDAVGLKAWKKQHKKPD